MFVQQDGILAMNVTGTCTSDSVMPLGTLGKQYEEYIAEKLVNRSLPIMEKINLSEPNLMKQRNKAKLQAQEVKELKYLTVALSQLYVASEACGGDITFFSHKNWPH